MVSDISTDQLKAPTRKLLHWYLLIRLFVVCFFLGGSIVYQLRQTVWDESLLARLLVYLTATTLLQTGFSLFILNRIHGYRHFINFQLTWDLLFVTLVIYLTGGVESLYSFLFILVIIAASVFCPRPQLLIVASAAAILYGSLLDLQYYGYLPLFGGLSYPPSLRQHDIFYAVFLHFGAFFLTALLSGTLADRLRVSEAAREQREVDYSELEQLNRAILANINSGLMIVNPQGRIRSFNAAASKITGCGFQDVYNKPVEALFPEFNHLDVLSGRSIERGEINYQKDEGTLILGYSASQVYDLQRRNLGLLIAFQDLTEYKELEEQLKRADHLSALGRLASGMAHEIRNPLASISGSVQLLMEEEKVSQENLRLMQIVVKEADRLSLLLSDFLNFAKPAPLNTEEVDISAMVDELVDLLVAGGRYPGVLIQKHYPPDILMNVDRQKIRQVLWDLLLNAADASMPEGNVDIAIDPDKGQIIINDTGPGIAADIRDKIFEPFYTTKEKGTGLGLANVYTNIEAHQGDVEVQPSVSGGARFIVSLPKKCWTRGNKGVTQ